MCHCYVDSALFWRKREARGGNKQVMREGSTMGVTQDTFGPPLGIIRTGDMIGGGMDVEGPSRAAMAASSGYRVGL